MSVVINPLDPSTGKEKTTREAITEYLEKVYTAKRGGILEAIPFKGTRTIDTTLSRMVSKNDKIGDIYRDDNGYYRLVDKEKLLQSYSTIGGQSVVLEEDFRLFPKNGLCHRIFGRCSNVNINSSGVVLKQGEKVPFHIEGLAPGKNLVLLYQGSTLQWWLKNKRPGYSAIELVRAFRFLHTKLFELGISGQLLVESFEVRNQQNVKVIGLKGLYELPLIEDQLTLRAYQEDDILNTEVRFEGAISLDHFLQTVWATKANVQSLHVFDKLVSNTQEAIKDFYKKLNTYGQTLSWETQASRALHKAHGEQISSFVKQHGEAIKAIDEFQDKINDLETSIEQSTSVINNSVVESTNVNSNAFTVIASAMNRMVEKIGGIDNTTPPSQSVYHEKEPLTFTKERHYVIAEEIITTIMESPGIWPSKMIKNLGVSRNDVFYILRKLKRQGILTMIKEGQKNKYYLSGYSEEFT